MKFLIMIIGPTAVGKTEFAIKVAKHFGTGIISADSRQIYREMSIGTAVPNVDQLADVKHYLIGHRSVEMYYNVSMFEKEALDAIGILHNSSEIAVMTGGSGMYCDVIEHGIDDLPDIDLEIRKELRKDFENNGLAWLQHEVESKDPEYYATVDRKNPARLLRALEVITASGQKFSSLRLSSGKERSFSIIKTGLIRPKEELNQRIEFRVDRMVSEGLVDECLKLVHFKNKSALKTVGYKEIFDFFEEMITFDEAIGKIKTNTRRYAKRQMTWFRRDNTIRWFHPHDFEEYIVWLTKKIKDLNEGII